MTIAMMLLAVAVLQAQTVISGVVLDKQKGRPLSHVSIVAEGKDIHTVTNDEGRFTLKTCHSPRYIEVSHIGYKTRRVPVTDNIAEPLRILMVNSSVELREVIVSVDDPLSIVKAAMSRITQNYPKETELMRCFYRETAQRGSQFISVAEAVTEMYKTSYQHTADHDAVAILKGRRLMSMKAKDTLGVKIQGGPLMAILADVAKNPDYLLNEQTLRLCRLSLEEPVNINDRMHYVVLIHPSENTLLPQMGGRLYIDRETYTISRAELQLDTSDWLKASEYMLVSKPRGLRFRPKMLSTTIVYHTDQQGVTRLNYIRNEMRFNCNWKRRLFARTFTTVSEMVVTDRLEHGKTVRRPQGRSSFGIKERFYDKVAYFDDPYFWADYNIIEPTESLEHSIDKLKKKAQPAK